MRVLEGLQPAAALGFFETLCSIPHGSRDTKAISDYCVRFAQERGLSWQQDASNNVIIRKPASPGYEDHPTVILQGHLDMVCEKDADCDIDFSKDGLRLRHEGLPFGAACLRFGFFCLGLGLFALCDLRLIVDAVEVVARVSLRLVVRRGTACRQQCQQQ